MAAGGPGDDVARHFAYGVTQDAAELVNRWWNESNFSMVRDPVIARPWTNESGPFSFELDGNKAALLSADEKAEIRHLCTRAVKQRIADDSRDLGALIIGHARIGQNFFDYFH
jgi:hypothetical protein